MEEEDEGSILTGADGRSISAVTPRRYNGAKAAPAVQQLPVDSWNTEMLTLDAPTLAPKVGFALDANQTETLSTTPRVPPPPLGVSSLAQSTVTCDYMGHADDLARGCRAKVRPSGRRRCSWRLSSIALPPTKATTQRNPPYIYTHIYIPT